MAPGTRRSSLVVAVAILLGAFVGFGVKAVLGPSAHERSHDAHSVNTWASWRFHFDTSAEMFATSDLVVEGNVASVARGRILPGNSDVRQQVKEFRITATKVWKGSVPRNPLVVEDSGWEISSAPGEGEMELVVEDAIQPPAGARGVFFLLRDPSDGRLAFVNNQGIFLVSGDQVMDTPRSDALVGKIERLSWPGLQRQLRRDLRLVRNGDVLAKRG